MTQQSPSPLRMVVRDPAVHALIQHLSALRRRVEAEPSRLHTLKLSSARLDEVRGAFNTSIRRGEATLHRLCARLVAERMDGRCDKKSVVIAETPGTRERVRIEHQITDDALYGLTDLALGMSVLERVRFREGYAWVEPRLIANFVEYLPLGASDPVIHKIVSRIKAEEEVWNKVVDEIFDLDGIVTRDKQLSKYSRFVKDVFGVKIVVGNVSDARRVHRWLLDACADQTVFRDVGPDGEPLQVIETKDYLAGGKASGWEALKSVVTAGGQPIEIQIQPLDNHVQELQRLTEQSHDAFKLRREQLRDRVAEGIPLFGYYRALLRWMFMEPGEPAPTTENIQVVLEP